MARKIFVQSGGGGGGGGTGKLVTELPLVSSASFAVSSYLFTQRQNGGISQLNANQLMWACLGADTSNIGFQAQPFQVSNSGVITLGTAQTVINSSGTSISTTISASEPAPGRYFVVGRMYWAGAYSVMPWGAQVASNNTVSVSRYSASDYSTTAPYAHPNAGTPVSTGVAGTYVWVPGYTTNGYGAANRYDFDGGSNYTYATGSVLNSYSSTHYGFQALQHWSDTQARCGVMCDHRDSTSGFYFREYYGEGSARNLGYTSSVFGGNDYSTIVGQRLSGGKAVYWNGSGRYIVTDGAGTTLLQGGNVIPPSVATSTGYHGGATIALGNDFFAAPSSSGGWLIYKPTLDGSNNLSFSPKANLFYGAGLGAPVAIAGNTGLRLAGDQQQYLVHAGPGFVSVYDAAALKELMV